MTTVVHNSRQSEIWIGYAKGTSTTVNEVLIYNYDHKTWTIRDAPNASGMTTGAAGIPNGFDNSDRRVIFAAGNALIETDQGMAFYSATEADGRAPINAFVERRGFDIAPNATNIAKWVDSVYYLITGSGNVRIDTRSTEAPGRPVDFSSTTDRYLKTRTFDLDPTMGDYKIDPRSTGRYYNTRIGSNDDTNSWQLIRYNLAFSADGER